MLILIISTAFVSVVLICPLALARRCVVDAPLTVRSLQHVNLPTVILSKYTDVG